MRYWKLATALSAFLLLTACGTPGTPGTSSPSPSPTQASPSPSPTPDDDAGPLVLPTCDDVFTADQVVALMGDGLDALGDVSSPGGGGYGTNIPETQQLIEATEGAVNCTWVLPGSERGANLSIVPASSDTRAAAALQLTSSGFTPSMEGTTEYFFMEDTGDFPYTEAHAIGGADVDLWICSYDGHGTNALEIVRAAWDSVVALNPDRF